MSASNNEGHSPTNMELLKQQASACGTGCACHAGSTPGKARWVIGAIVLVAAGVLVVRAMTRTDNGATVQAPAPDFAAPVAAAVGAVEPSPAAKGTASVQPAETSVGTVIGAFSELNTAAANTDAVFVYLPGKEVTPGKPPSTPLKGAVRMIESQGKKCALFTLKAGTRDYDQIAAQMPVPGVVAMVKGAGMSAVSGDITESKLVQGFVAASRAGGCGPASGGCGPATAGCK